MRKSMKRFIVFCMLMVLGGVSNLSFVHAASQPGLNYRSPMYISYQSGYNDFSVRVNDPNKVYSVKDDVSWLSIYMADNRKGNNKFCINVSENKTGHPRTANISIVFDNPDQYDFNTTFQVVQKAAPFDYDPVYVE